MPAVCQLRPLAVLVACVAVLLGACGAGPAPGAAQGEWVYLDGSGAETKLPKVPERIVMHSNVAAALIPLGVRPVGIYADTRVKDDLALKNLDLSGIQILGEEWGKINIEATAALRPDLIIAEWWPLENAYSGLEEGTGGANQRLRDIAPIAGPAQGPSIHKMIQDYEALASRLGADLEAAGVKGDRARFEAARASFEAATRAKPNLSVLAVSPSPEGLYVAMPKEAAELSDFVSWGMNVMTPGTPDPEFAYWETLSWENAGKYQADLLIIDERTYPSNLEQARTHPTWSFLKAVPQNQVAVWPAFWLRNYRDYAMALDRLTTAINATNENLV